MSNTVKIIYENKDGQELAQWLSSEANRRMLDNKRILYCVRANMDNSLIKFGLYAGIKPLKNAREPNFSDMNPTMNMFVEKNNNVRNHMPGYFTPPSKTPTEFNDTIFRSTLKQVLPVKGDVDAVKYGRGELPKNDYMYPQQGYARGQHLGLATDNNKPMDRPIMPIAGYYNPDMVNVLGNLA